MTLADLGFVLQIMSAADEHDRLLALALSGASDFQCEKTH